jgi:hypothetical protein
MTVNTSNPSATAINNPLMLMPRLLLNAEAAVFFFGAIALYINQGGSLLLFVLLILAPDLGMLGYLVNARVGSVIYNTIHFYLLPVALFVLCLAAGSMLGIQIALIWFTHISMDRILGYGLKYPTKFKDTHFQHV